MSNFELRLAALSKLVGIKSAAVDQRLHDEFNRIEVALQTSTDYDELSESLKTLAVLVPRYHMATLPLLETFVRSVSNRTLTQDGSPISGSWIRYRSAGSLIRDAVDVVEKVRYLHTEQVVDFLLELSHVEDKEVKTKVERALGSLATIDLDIFYGDPPLGASPQARMVKHLSGMQDEALLASAGIILRVLSIVLSPTMEGTSWSYQSITIRRGSITSDGGIADMRLAAIYLTQRIYKLDTSVEHRKQVLLTLDSATRREEALGDDKTSAMFERDAIMVLEFMLGLVGTEALPLVQKIEHLAYWDYYHGASQAIKDEALKIRDALDAHTEYQVYKQLIGFEGIFGNWEELRRSERAWDYSDNKRRDAARKYLDEINEDSYLMWRDRLLEFSKTRSNDLAMFPVYYDFLESIGKERPALALELLTTHEEVMAPFLIALVRGLWTSATPEDIETVVKCWIEAGQHLTTIAKSLYKVGASRLKVLEEVADRAAALDDREAMIQVMGVAASLHVEGAMGAKAIFMLSLRELAKRNDTSWAGVIWFSRDFRTLVSAMDQGERSELLASLTSLPELGYQAEDVLYEIGKHDLHAVIDLLVGRLKHSRMLAKQKRESDESSQDRFEAIPFQLTKLNELLAQAPDALLTALRADFDSEDHHMFSYRGARIVKSALPEFETLLEESLLKYVKTGNDDDIGFVIGILRAYEGSSAILGVCKEIIKAAPEYSKTWNEVAAAIESTGVVGGEYGMVEAYSRKLQQVSSWESDENERVRSFAGWLKEALHSLIEQERQRADQRIALRKYQYGGEQEED
ncbi:hypothetical protein ACET4R_22330 [Pseudomonas aeruginosa]|uniref:hypothetical protein n=1 Tax=Pseudomonas aeruginosa TaxID=287 RepID=UPI00058341F7|nr:hypothetical protein [Pseudomonas aeruginosa]MBI7342668.1 hypothetical protein [Pseudomonas aeruginosa]MBI7456814.1 hypothetical protein [Pseudomonas aeruginosa]MBI7486033.1 hypothetical protein [Pseudomonas aeruginosa]MBI8462801.1 hypothetical protein [Pseudomonas aeruginosa]MBI8486212.1 hypothetical protein [Pseudomonas aeruginosa]